VEKAQEELVEASKQQKKAGKCTKYLVCFIFIAMIGVGLALYFTVFNPPK